MATAFTMASIAVSTMGNVAGGKQEQRQAESRARMAKIQSDQTEATSLDELRRQIGNIKAIRASAGASAKSPTTQAIIDSERRVSQQNLDKKKASYKLDELQALADKKIYKSKAAMSLASGALSFGKAFATSL